jgi:hypothetical protein
MATHAGLIDAWIGATIAMPDVLTDMAMSPQRIAIPTTAMQMVRLATHTVRATTPIGASMRHQ